MSNSLKTQTRHALEVVIAFVPWVISMYVLYWLNYSEVWTIETAHRGKISVAILAAGMALSFLVQSHFSKRRQKLPGSQSAKEFGFLLVAETRLLAIGIRHSEYNACEFFGNR